MSEVIAFNRSRRRTGKKAARLALVAEIIDVLDKLGGSAHRDVVVDQIACERGLVTFEQLERLREEVTEIFVAHCEQKAPPERTVFCRVFGPDSRRWGLAQTFEERRRHGEEPLELLVAV